MECANYLASLTVATVLCLGVLDVLAFFRFSRIYCVGKTCVLRWEYVVRFCPDLVGLLESVVGCVAMLVDETSMLVRLLVDVCDLIHLGVK